jgi:hypothetical protein
MLWGKLCGFDDTTFAGQVWKVHLIDIGAVGNRNSLVTIISVVGYRITVDVRSLSAVARLLVNYLPSTVTCINDVT